MPLTLSQRSFDYQLDKVCPTCIVLALFVYYRSLNQLTFFQMKYIYIFKEFILGKIYI